MLKIQALSKDTNPNLVLIKGEYHFINLQTMLGAAMDNGFGVGAINIRSKYILDAVLEAAFEEKSPVIIETAESETVYCNLPPSRFGEMVTTRVEKLVKKYGYMVPVTLHMDHVQKDLDLIDQAIAHGYSSVEVDQSRHPFEKNIEITKQTVEKCHPLGISVEGEIGEIGAANALKDKDLQKNLINYVPDVDEVIKLVKKTGIDAFAGFFGNGHGKYMQTPIITWKRIKEIVSGLKQENILVPLVLHGGSYLQTGEFDKIQVFVEAVRSGCHKFNYATTISDIFKTYLPVSLNQKMEEEAKKQNSAWRKMLGQFEEEIDTVDPNRINNAKAEMASHLKMMMRHAWMSSRKAELYPSSIY